MAKNKDQKNPPKKNRRTTDIIVWIIAAAVVLAIALAVSGDMPFMEKGKETGKSFNLHAKETRPVLDPSMFTGQVRAAYTAALKYPEVFNEVFCYCYCNEPPFNHETLLSCFVEKHGAG